MERRWLKISAGKAIGITTIVGFFLLLSGLYQFEIVDLTGDLNCTGTYKSPCISEFQVKNPNAFVVDIYNKDQARLKFSPNIYDYALFVPDGRCSASGACACELKDGRKLGFEDWRCVDFTNETKPRQDKQYNFRFPAYSTTTFRLAGIKENTKDKIKWTFLTNDEELDPVWDESVDRFDNVNDTIELREDQFDIDFKIYKIDSGTGEVTQVRDIWTDAERRAFGHNETEGTELIYNIVSSSPIIEYRGRYYVSYKTRTYDKIENVIEHRAYLDYTKECEAQYEPVFIRGELEFNLIFDPNCTFNLIDSNTLELRFFAQDTNNLQVILEDVSTYPSVLNNITVENNYSHLSIGDNSIGFINQNNVVFYFSSNVNASPLTLYDDSENNIDGTFAGTARFVDEGLFGGGFVTENQGGASDSGNAITLPNPANLDVGTFTTGGWVRANALPSSGAHVHHASETGSGDEVIRLTIQADSDIEFRNDFGAIAGCYDPSVHIQIGNWTHIMATLNATMASMYRNGVLCTTDSTITANSGSIGAQHFLGARAILTQSGFNGTYDNFMLLNTSLTGTQVLALYNNQSSIYYPRGEQIFEEVGVNATSSATEDFLNVSIESNQFFGSLLNVSVGTSGAGAYSYSSEFDLSDNFESDIDITTPANISLKLVFYAGNESANSYHAPNLINNITLDSFDGPDEGDSCTYTSGNWDIDCSDNCVISSNVDVGGNNIFATGTGTFTINNNIKVSNWVYRSFDRTCYYTAFGDGGFY